MKKPKTIDQLLKENEDLRIKLQEAEDILQAIREGAIDAIVVKGCKGEQVFTLTGEEQIYRVLVETMGEAGITTTPEGKIFFCNRQFSEMVNTPMEEIVGQYLEKFVKESDHKKMTAMLIKAKVEPLRKRLVLLAADGTSVPAWVSANLLKHGNSVSICLVAMDQTELEASKEAMQQITEQREELQTQREKLLIRNKELRKAHIELEVSRHRYSDLYDFAPVGYFVLDKDGLTLDINLTGAALLGVKKTLIIGKHFSNYVNRADHDAFFLFRRKVFETRCQQTCELQLVEKNKSLFYALLFGSRVKDPYTGSIRCRMAVTNITERKNVEKQLNAFAERRHLEKEILDITEREREQIGQELHDGIGQVLTGIAVKCKGLALKLKSKSLDESKEVMVISKLANEAIGQTRNLARMLYPVAIETFGLVAILKEMASNTEKMLAVRCRFRCGKSVSVKNLVEAKQIYRIVQEAITNAIKHGKAKNINIKLRFTKRGTVLSVENDGLDFPKSLPIKKGLGLKIMKYRTDLIGGSLDIRKADKGGTIVICTFPNRGQKS
jgi:PAS domain S-box-containing protein